MGDDQDRERAPADVRVGTSGWRYAGWRGDFYPRGLAQRRELEHAALRMNALEVNGSFYSLQRATSWRRWAAQTPDDFRFAVKGPRFVTHLKRLREPHQALANFFASGLLELGPRLGPVLWQLPADLALDLDLLDAFLGALPRSTDQAGDLARRHDAKVKDPSTVVPCSAPLRHALEARSPSFASGEAEALLRTHGVASVVADSAGRWPVLDRVTADHVYVRLHGDQELYTSGYSDAALDAWASRCRGWAARGLDVAVFFDNDAAGRAPHDAMGLLRRLGLATAVASTG